MDILEWRSRSPIRTELTALSSDPAVMDTYKMESDRLGYKPQPVMAWGAAIPFRDGKLENVATFRRLTKTVFLRPDMPNVRLPAVIYMSVKDLMKPTWFDAVALWHLVKPYKILFAFE